MRNPYTHNISLMLEEWSRKDESLRGKWLQILLYRTLADNMWSPFKIMCFNPVFTAAFILILYIIFTILYAPLWVISMIFTSYGAFILLIVLVILLGNRIARAIAFAGGNVSIQKQISADLARRILQYIDMVATHISDFSATLLLGATGKISSGELFGMATRFEEINSKSASLLPLANQIKNCAKQLQQSSSTSSTDALCIDQLCESLDEQVRAMAELMPHAAVFLSNPENVKIAHREAIISMDSKYSELIKTASNCLKASKGLKVSVKKAKPAAPDDDEGSLVNRIKCVVLGKTVEGFEKITFPYMRTLLQQRYKVQNFELIGGDGNKIDGVIFCASALSAAPSANSSQSLSTSAAAPALLNSERGLVLFCSPNAGFYEGISQCDMNTSWVGYYLRLGLDVCMYNYRGYGLSTGVCDPHSVRQDASVVYQFMQESRKPLRIIVHGESIGGVAACYLAKTFPVDALICDRTFASLDATAARLMGSWAGYGLMFCSLWSTNVMRDYLACSCPKVILQDPEDEIIANLSSLKNGIATRLVMNDLSWRFLPAPVEYNIAAYFGNEQLPHAAEESVMIAEAANPAEPLTESFILHLYVCLHETARMGHLHSREGTRVAASEAHAAATSHATNPHSNRRRHQAHAGHTPKMGSPAPRSNSNSNVFYDVESATESDNERDVEDALESRVIESSEGPNHSDNNTLSRNLKRQGSQLLGHLLNGGGSTRIVAGGAGNVVGDETDDSSLFSSSMDEVEQPMGQKRGDMDQKRPKLSNGGESEQIPQSKSSSTAQASLFPRAPRSRRAWMEHFCSMNVTNEASESAYMRAWVTMARVDGGTGQILGQAVSYQPNAPTSHQGSNSASQLSSPTYTTSNIEGFRAWVCSWLVWSLHATKDASIPTGENLLFFKNMWQGFYCDKFVAVYTGCTDLLSAVSDLQYVIDTSPVEMQNFRPIHFVLAAFQALLIRREKMTHFKPPMNMMMRGATSFWNNQIDVRAQLDAVERGYAIAFQEQAGCAPCLSEPAAVQNQNALSTKLLSCYRRVMSVLGSNPYASFDMCNNTAEEQRIVLRRLLINTNWVGKSISNGVITSLQCCPSFATQCLMTYNELCNQPFVTAFAAVLSQWSTAVSNASAQSSFEAGPYIGTIIPLHCGHNGWPAPHEISALTEFMLTHGVVEKRT